MSLRTAFGLSSLAGRLVTGTPDEQRQSRREWRRAKDAQGIKDRWPEIPSARLVRGRGLSVMNELMSDVAIQAMTSVRMRSG